MKNSIQNDKKLNDTTKFSLLKGKRNVDFKNKNKKKGTTKENNPKCKNKLYQNK